LITTSELESVHERMREEFAAAGARFDAVYYCPHDFQPPCECRKPQPGMLLKAARKHELDLSRSWMVGDSEHDMEAGRRAGCRTVRVMTDKQSMRGCADSFASSLPDAVERILEFDVHFSVAVPSSRNTINEAKEHL
jgi:D-glycero-D-manno-heptose 1,7-bisphosphate phosphatase